MPTSFEYTRLVLGRQHREIGKVLDSLAGMSKEHPAVMDVVRPMRLFYRDFHQMRMRELEELGRREQVGDSVLAYSRESGADVESGILLTRKALVVDVMVLE